MTQTKVLRVPVTEHNMDVITGTTLIDETVKMRLIAGSARFYQAPDGRQFILIDGGKKK